MWSQLQAEEQLFNPEAKSQGITTGRGSHRDTDTHYCKEKSQSRAISFLLNRKARFLLKDLKDAPELLKSLGPSPSLTSLQMFLCSTALCWFLFFHPDSSVLSLVE